MGWGLERREGGVIQLRERREEGREEERGRKRGGERSEESRSHDVTKRPR